MLFSCILGLPPSPPAPLAFEQLMLPSIPDDDESLLPLLLLLVSSIRDLIEVIGFILYIPVDSHMVDGVPLQEHIKAC